MRSHRYAELLRPDVEAGGRRAVSVQPHAEVLCCEMSCAGIDYRPTSLHNCWSHTFRNKHYIASTKKACMYLSHLANDKMPCRTFVFG